MKNFVIEKTNEKGLIPLFCGNEKCKPCHTFGPFVREYYLIHYCISGQGTLCDKYGEHRVGAGEIFIIREGELTTYYADKKNPWTYTWISFVGDRRLEFDNGGSVYSVPRELCARIMDSTEREECAPEIYQAYLYETLHRIKAPKNEPSDVLSNIRRYVEYNYMMPISVESISTLFGFERSYLYRIFKARYGTGLKEHIIAIRMKKAKELLLIGHSVSSVSSMVGYSDEFAFSKAYKTFVGLSPIAFKRREG